MVKVTVKWGENMKTKAAKVQTTWFYPLHHAERRSDSWLILVINKVISILLRVIIYTLVHFPIEHELLLYK